MILARLSLLLALTLQGSLAAWAKPECRQDRAVYADPDGVISLSFKAKQEDVPSVTSNEFTIALKEPAVSMDGVVMWNEGVSRPNGIVMYQCPGGDVTGADLEACTVWQGVIYSLEDGSNAGLLPTAGEPAAEALLFPDFAAYASAFDFKTDEPLKSVPFEVFRFKDCVE
ncbi:MAG: hypothetical protein ACRECW_17460 [Phyllobacterium sp.]